MSLDTKDIMVDKVVTTKKNATLEHAVSLMNEHEIGCLVVVEGEKPVGIITERDLLKRCLAKSKELGKIKVEDIMSKPVVTVNPDLQIEEAAKLMCEKKIKKLPIVEGDKLRGLVTLTDILRIQPQLIRMYKIFSSDLAPRRMRKVFDYYLLLRTQDTVDVDALPFFDEEKPETE